MERIFHIAFAADWHAAQASGDYGISTRGRTLDEVGFIHASYANQVSGVANAFYGGIKEQLVLLVIDRQRLRPTVRDEAPEGSSELFPHIYGPLNLDAVVEVQPFEPDSAGRFS